MQYGLLALPRTTSSSSCNNQILIPSAYPTSSSLVPTETTPKSIFHKTRFRLTTLLRSFLTSIIPIPHALIPHALIPKALVPTRRHLTSSPALRRKVTGTLFGHRRGHVSFSVQPDPRCGPALVIQLPVTTANLVREMSSGTVRIALETDARAGHVVGLFQEPTWSMYCNGKKCGYAASRTCNDSDWHVLKTVGSVSIGAGVIPVVGDGKKGTESEGELMYMRAKFERVVGSRDSEAFYMMNPDGNGGPELSIFLLRI